MLSRKVVLKNGALERIYNQLTKIEYNIMIL